jgi:hypothetical protein
MSMIPPPWLMWGSQQTVNMPRPSGAGTWQQDSPQLARVSYGRPDTWTFLFGYRITASDLVGGPWVLQVDFNVLIGVGRALTQLTPLARFQFQNGSAASPIQWATRVPTPQMIFSDATTIEQCDQFPAQDIQCQARVIASGVTAGTGVTVDVFSYFAPRTHIRPEWFTHAHAQTEQFRGNEQKGS